MDRAALAVKALGLEAPPRSLLALSPGLQLPSMLCFLFIRTPVIGPPDFRMMSSSLIISAKSQFLDKAYSQVPGVRIWICLLGDMMQPIAGPEGRCSV